MVRELLVAVAQDRDLVKDLWLRRDPQTFSAGALVFPANRLNQLLHEYENCQLPKSEATPIPADEPIVVGGKACVIEDYDDGMGFIVEAQGECEWLNSQGEWRVIPYVFPTHEAAIEFARGLADRVYTNFLGKGDE